MMRRPLPVRQVALARGRKPGSFDSADSAQDDTKIKDTQFAEPSPNLSRKITGEGSEASPRERLRKKLCEIVFGAD